MDDFAGLKQYIDSEGRLTKWPSPRNKQAQQLALRYLAEKFEFGRIYTEREINDILNQHHTFGDHALLRREMFEQGIFNREPDGSKYWRTNAKFF